MKKRFAVIVLSLCMVLALIPTAAFAADGDTIHVGGVALTGSEAEPAYALTDDSGSVTTEGAGESSYNIRWDGSTLTLNNATITQGYSQGYYIGAVTAISCEADIEIELVGSNTVRGPALTDEGAAETSGIYSEGSITISGTGTLDVRGGGIEKTTGGGSAQSYGLYSGGEGNITISSGTVNAFGGDIDTVNGSASSSGISADGATVITGGKVTAAGGEITNNSGHAASIGIESYGRISIAGGSVEATGSSANVTGVDGNYAYTYSKGMYAYSGGISITGGSVEATGGSVEIISQDENATLYAESGGIDADNMNDSGGMSITGGSTVTATGGAAAGDGGDGIAYSFGISTDERITVAGSTVTATGGTAEGSEFSESYGIEHLEVIEISASTVTAYGEDEAILTDEPVRVSSGVSDQALEVKVGENAESAEEIGGSPFTEETDICHSIEGAKYFHSELVDPREPQPVEAYVRVGDLQLTASVGSPAYALTDEDGSVTAEGAGESNYNIRWDGQTLTLRNATITEGACEFDDGEAAAAIYKLYGLAVELIGSNTVTGPSDGGGERDTFSSYGIFAEEGELTITGSGSLDVSGGNVAGENPVIFVESIGIGADGDIMITDTTVEAAGGTVSGDYAGSRGIESNDGVIITGSTVTAAGGETTAGDWGAYSTGIEAYNDLVITGSKVEAAGSAAASSSGSAGSSGIYSYWDVMITDSIVTAAGSEANAGAWDAYSFGIYAEENINISSGSVNVFGGSAECSSDPETAASLGMNAGTVNISGGDVTAEAGQTGAWTADGIWALLDINITGGRVTATGASSSADGVMPQYSGGLFSYAGDITVSGEDTVVNAGGGVAGEGITAIAATGGDIVIESGAVRADGASGAPSGFEGLANGLSALKDTYEDDGTGGNIIISGGYLSVAGATDSIYYEGDLVIRPAACGITVRTMDNWITGGDASGPDWDKMDQDAAEIDGSPFTEETVIERGLTEGKLYLGATDGSTYPEDPADPDNPADPTDPDDPADSTGGQNGDGTQNGDAGQTGESTKTGDDSNILMWTALLVAAGAGIFTSAVYMSKRKQRENRRGI